MSVTKTDRPPKTLNYNFNSNKSNPPFRVTAGCVRGWFRIQFFDNIPSHAKLSGDRFGELEKKKSCNPPVPVPVSPGRDDTASQLVWHEAHSSSGGAFYLF